MRSRSISALVFSCSSPVTLDIIQDFTDLTERFRGIPSVCEEGCAMGMRCPGVAAPARPVWPPAMLPLLDSPAPSGCTSPRPRSMGSIGASGDSLEAPGEAMVLSPTPPVCACTRRAYSPFFSTSSSWEPCSTAAPCLRTKMMSEFLTVERRCATVRVVMLSLTEDCSLSSVACTSLSDSLSRAEVASSRSSNCGLFTNARAMAMRCFWPPDICSPPVLTPVSNFDGKAFTKS
mmetsp:Transcript_15030/g.38641  ORF Transcript_15030/g.38641 Transcript_15030/m.38641 type:complete len:233 (+) Transcript_15030:344-1042(+)